MARYERKAWKPALMFEVLLPKKLEYFGMLQNVLETLFDEERIRQVPAIRQELAEAGPGASIHRWIAEVVELFTGYTMYEVDGRFLDRASGRQEDERVIVIRLIFHDPAAGQGMREDFRDLVEEAVHWLIGDRLASELGTEQELWITSFGEPRIQIWRKMTS